MQSKRSLIEISLVAIIYFVTAKIGQTLSIPPGNVTPVWIPSGLMLAWALLRGYSIWPGIFIGAFLGNVWAYIDFSDYSIILLSLFTGTANGIGDVLCAVGAAYFIEKTTKGEVAFSSSSYVIIFIILGAVAGPLVSALFGVSTLYIAGFLPGSKYLSTLLTWWTGDGVGVLVLTPTIVCFWLLRKRDFIKNHRFEPIAYFLSLLFVAFLCLKFDPSKDEIKIPLFFLAPILIGASFRLGQRNTYLGVFITTALSIIATALGFGPFSGQALNVSLLELQWFITILSITVYIVDALVRERRMAFLELVDAHENLEIKVQERTAELQKALDEIRTLRGIIPICSHCKVIRNDKGSWIRLEQYIEENSEAEFSHSICDDCMEKHYPEED